MRIIKHCLPDTLAITDNRIPELEEEHEGGVEGGERRQQAHRCAPPQHNNVLFTGKMRHS
jgi:hypothetical protein